LNAKKLTILTCAIGLGGAIGATAQTDLLPTGAPPAVHGPSSPTVSVMVEPDDAIPLPEPALVEAGPDGDRVIRPATGNPHFLGFVAGDHTPPAGETIDPLLTNALATFGSDMRPDPVVYGFVMFAKRITAPRIAQLEELGVRDLGFHPHHSLRVAIPPEAIPTVANLDFVRWVGVARSWQKVHPALENEYAKWDSNTKVAVYINVFDDDLNPSSTSELAAAPTLVDPVEGVRPGAVHENGARAWMSNGWQQEELEKRGVEVREYVPGIRAFRAEITWSTMQDLLPLDFVQFVEIEPIDTLNHDESVPMIAADLSRAFFDGGTSQSAIIGEIDSGFDNTHESLNHVFAVTWDHSLNQTGVMNDICGHGTHVAGTILGKPPASNFGLTGNAPGLAWGGNGRARFVKYLDFVAATGKCSGSSTSHATLYAHMRGNYGTTVTSGPPHVINNSWGASTNGPAWTGTEANARTVDNEVFNEDQIYVFSAGNTGPTSATVGLPAVAKNVLTVGSVLDYKNGFELPGVINASSSRGPTGDGRWKPNLVAPGRWIRSAAAGTTNSYVDLSGTSMAAPHVTGVIAQLADSSTIHRYNPATTHAVLMATAIPKDGEVLSSANELHLDNYGTGRVSASSAVFNEWDTELVTFGFQAAPTLSKSGDFTVPVGTKRLVVVMNYVEPSASSGASSALRNDFDLWLDQSPFQSGGNTGEYFSHQSAVDNTEVRTILAPTPGPWRWKCFPKSATETVKVGVAVFMQLEDITPPLVAAINQTETYVQPNEEVEISATYTNLESLASAVYVETSATSTPTYVKTTRAMFDGSVADVSGNQSGGRDVTYGDIPGASGRGATWTVRWPTDGVKEFNIATHSDNADDRTDTATVIVDGTDPTIPTNLTSTTHSLNVWSNDPLIGFAWTAATDATSGLAGYSRSTNLGSPLLPDTVQDLGNVTSFTTGPPSSNVGYYFGLRSVDQAGNWDSSFASTGPYLIDTIDPIPANGFGSPTHSVGTWSNDPNVTFTWNAAVDSTSGLDGYSFDVTGSALGIPDTIKDIGPLTSVSQTLSSTSTGWYFDLRAVDLAGNWESSSTDFGPFLIDTVDPAVPTIVKSTSHTTNTWSNDTQLDMAWTTATDAHSGLAGYDTLATASSSTTAAGIIDSGPSSNATTVNVTSAATPWYFHIAPIDVAGNVGATKHTGPFLVDAVDPAGPSGLLPTTHTVGTLSNATSLTVKWSVATDAHSGLAGYATLVDENPGTVPAGALDTPANATGKATSFPTPTGTNEYWFHVRARDVAGNWGQTQHIGPFVIGICNTPGSNQIYGIGKPGSFGTPKLVAQDVPTLGEPTTVTISNAFPGSFPYLILGASQTNVAWDGGTLLASLNFFIALPVPIQANGTLPLTGLLPADASTCGVTIYHQVLVPDPGATGFYGLAMTNGLARTFGS